MGKKGLNYTKMLSVSAIDSFISAADAASPSSSSPSSSSSSSCVVDCHNNNNVSDLVHNQRVDNEEEEEKPSKPPKRVRRKSINDMSNDTCHPNIATPPPPTNKRSSIYRGVTRHRWTGRFEAHLWDKSSWNTLQNKKGRQVYLGAYDSEVDAARTYDLAALKYWGPETTLNFSIENYTKELDEMQSATKEGYLASLRRRSSGFSRGVSKYRGVARHHHNGRWEARIGRVFGNKYLYLGTFGSQEEAAAAYDLAAIEYRGANAVTNFDISNYIGRVKNFLPKGRKQTQNPDQKKATQPRRPNVKVQVKQREESQEDLEEVQQIKQQKDDEQQGLKVHQTKQQKEEQPDDEEVKLQDLQQVHQEEPTEMQSQFSESKLISSTDHSSILVMDGAQDDRENPWSFCLDTGGYDPLLVPDIPLEEDGKLLDLFDQTGFEDNIDLIFEGEGNLIGVDATYFDGIYESGCHSNDLEKNTKVSPNMESLVCCSSPSSSSSRTSLVSC